MPTQESKTHGVDVLGVLKMGNHLGSRTMYHAKYTCSSMFKYRMIAREISLHV